MITQFACNFLLTLILLYLYLTKINYPILFDHNPLGLGSKKKTKTGAGIIFSIILLINYTYYSFDQSVLDIIPNRYYIFLISIFLLTTISFVDDLKPVDPRFRLIAQIVIIYFSLSLINLYYFDFCLAYRIVISFSLSNNTSQKFWEIR